LSRRTTQLIKAALATLYYSGADGLAAPLTRAEGVIFMLHRVTREPVAEFEPNRILKITPEFLESVIRHVMEAGFEFLALDEIPERLRSPRPGRPFACFTFDDGYRDNLTCALPIFRRFGIPLTVYVPTAGGADRGGVRDGPRLRDGERAGEGRCLSRHLLAPARDAGARGTRDR